MLNYVQGGARLDYQNNSGSIIPSGGLVVLNSGGGIGGINVAVAVDAIAIGAVGEVQIAGVFSFAKNAGEAELFAGNIYWNSGGSYLTNNPSGNTWAGVVADFDGDVSAATSLNVLINGIPYSG